LEQAEANYFVLKLKGAEATKSQYIKRHIDYQFLYAQEASGGRRRETSGG